MMIHITKPSLPSYFLSISLVALLTASAFVFGMNSTAYACSCALPESAKDALEYSDAVFSGKVTDISGKHPDNLTISRHDPVSVTFSVDRAWKGPVNSTMTISTESSEASCGYEFQQDESYIVYSYKKGNTSTLHTGLCSGTSLLSDSYDDLSELGDGTKILQPDDETFKSKERNKNEPFVLTTFEMHFKEDEFTKQGPNHNILRLDKGGSAMLNVYIKNNDDVPHQISMKDPRGVGISGTFESFVFEPEQFTVLPQQTNSTKLHLTVSNYTDTHSKFVTFLAQSDTFGMRGIGFFIVVDREIDEYVDKSLRRGLPGGAFPHLNTEISESEAEKLIGSGFGIPRYLPSGYEFQGMDGSEDSQRLIYSTVPIVTETTVFSEFWNNGGLLIIYGIDGPNVNNTKSLPFRIAQDEGQQVMINGMMGHAVQKQTRVVVESDITYDFPASISFFDDAKKKSVYLRANMPLDELLKIASSIPILDEMNSTQDESEKSKQYSEGLDPDPVLDLWNNHSEIIDGTIVSKTTYPSRGKGMTEFHVKLNKFFKPFSKDTESITLFSTLADSDITSILNKGDRALIYIEPKNQISSYSVKVDKSTYCEPRDYIQIAPVLPNDPNQLVRGQPTVPFDWKDQCVPDYFTEDPNFWVYREYRPPMQQWRVHDIPMEQQRCAGEGDDYVSVEKNGNANYKYCVKPETVSTLVERGWAVTNENGLDTFEFSFCGADGFDSKGNLNKDNSTHQWDENECQWIDRK